MSREQQSEARDACEPLPGLMLQSVREHFGTFCLTHGASFLLSMLCNGGSWGSGAPVHPVTVIVSNCVPLPSASYS